MREHIQSQLKPAVEPLLSYVPERAHELMALQLDPRYCKGEVFVDILGDVENARDLMKQYANSCLIPALVEMKKSMRSGMAARAVASTTGGTSQERAEVPHTAIDALSDDDEEADTEMDERALQKSVELELKSFWRSTLLPKAGDKKVIPLLWWRQYEDEFPVLGNLARLALATPGSHIECERVFSLAGLITKSLRNRMCHDNLAMLVFLRRNVDLDAKLKDLLQNWYGVTQFELAAPQFGSTYNETELMESELAECQSEVDPLNWGAVNSVLEGEEPLVSESEYFHHTLTTSRHWM